VVRGRIRRFDPPAIALEFTEIEAGASVLRFFAELQEVDAPVQRGAPSELPGVGAIAAASLPKGFRMVWRTKGL
jgi:hypothetical protein